jgi:5'(3')-deoxyribonucleotidase
MSSGFIIGLDLDGVCYHFDRTARYMLRRRLKAQGDFATANLLTDETAAWNGIQDVVPRSDWTWLWTDGIREGLFRYGHVVSGSIEGVQELAKIGEVVAITHRPKEAVHDTIVWLATMFDKAPLSGLVIQSHGQKKSDVRPLPAVYIDDAPHVADDILDNTASKVVLYDTAMNRHYPRHPRLFRALDWVDVVGIVREIKGEAP